MSASQFKLDIFTPERADVYVACPPEDARFLPLVEALDRASIRAIGDVAGLVADAERIRRIVSGCAGVLAVSPDDPELAIGVELGLPTCLADDPLDGFLAAVRNAHKMPRPYGFYIGRLERDFAHAREAIRTALENETGLPFLWVDDGRHRTNVESIRESTRLLLRHSSFVIADLTLGVESPERENPSRAHEIGMSIAYEKKLLLLSQEPRRYPYYNIGDLQMVFWSDEADLEARVRDWARIHRDALGRSVYNHRLRQPNIAPGVFRFDPKARYIGPKTPA